MVSATDFDFVYTGLNPTSVICHKASKINKIRKVKKVKQMGRINPDQMDNYSSNNDSEWLKLADDGDVERVQFLYDKYEDLDTFAVHKVRIDGQQYDRMVNCIRDYDDPVDYCPLCKAGYKVEPAMILSMWSHNDEKIKIWSRGKTFRKVIESKFNRYPNLSSMVFEIERHGKKNDQKTTYELIPMPDVESVDVSNIERPEFIGSVIIDADENDMMTFLNTGSFPQKGNDSDTGSRRRQVDEPVRRRDTIESRASRRRV